MPNDDPSLTPSLPAQRECTGRPVLNVMARIIRLPTSSRREALKIVRLQLDRLSPIPVVETVFDLAMIDRELSQGVFALGLIRRSALSDPIHAASRQITVRQNVEGHAVIFRFRNASAASNWERRWLAKAPILAPWMAGVAVVTLAGAMQSGAWREVRATQAADDGREYELQIRRVRDQAGARRDWKDLETVDAATRLSCVLARVGPTQGPRLGISRMSADADSVRMTLTHAADRDRLAVLGADTSGGAPGSTTAIFGSDVCG